MKRKLKRLLTALLLLCALLCAATPLACEALHYPAAATALSSATNAVSHSYTAGGDLIISPAEPATTALIFYPGALVEHTAYAPLLQQLAEQGWLCISVKMPCYMSFFGINSADALMAAYPQVENWYIGGHSLGGAMAASYAAKHSDALSGLVLLASYSTADLRSSDLPVCSIYGSHDTVLNAESYAQNRANLPANTTELVIEGGNHAGFGAYGPQKKDGIAAITAAEQQKITANHILGFYN